MFNKSLAFETIFAGGNVRHYTMHITLRPDAFLYATTAPGKPKPLREYHLVILDGIDMLSSVKAYCNCNGIASFCNLRKVAFEVRQAAVAAANARSAMYQRAGVPLPAFEVSFQGKPAAAETAAAETATAEGDQADKEAGDAAEEAEDEEDVEVEDDVGEDEAKNRNADETEDIETLGALASPVSGNSNRANNADNACLSSCTRSAASLQKQQRSRAASLRPELAKHAGHPYALRQRKKKGQFFFLPLSEPGIGNVISWPERLLA
jgi:hypothetical protein